MPSLRDSTIAQAFAETDARHDNLPDSILEVMANRWAARNYVIQQLGPLGVVPYYFPQLSTTKPPEGERTIPILITEPSKLKQKDHVIVILNDPESSLGIWSHAVRRMQPTMSVKQWSAIGLVEELQKLGEQAPGLVILNPGEMVWMQSQNRGVSGLEWDYLGKAGKWKDSVSSLLLRGHFPAQNHYRTVIRWILDRQNVQEDAAISIVAVGKESVHHVNKDLLNFRPLGSTLLPTGADDRLGPRLNAIAWMGWLPTSGYDDRFGIQKFYERSTRAWLEDSISLEEYDLEEGNLDIDRYFVDSGFPSSPEKHHFVMPLVQGEVLRFLLDNFECFSGGINWRV